MQSVQEWRQLASECRDLSRVAKDARVRYELAQAAAQYEYAAEAEAEAHAKAQFVQFSRSNVRGTPRRLI